MGVVTIPTSLQLAAEEVDAENAWLAAGREGLLEHSLLVDADNPERGLLWTHWSSTEAAQAFFEEVTRASEKEQSAGLNIAGSPTLYLSPHKLNR
jgi:heme-degrading monooxygenase HmoA